ncbi:hypothetical protein D3C71_977380 [compost metagenome]
MPLGAQLGADRRGFVVQGARAFVGKFGGRFHNVFVGVAFNAPQGVGIIALYFVRLRAIRNVRHGDAYIMPFVGAPSAQKIKVTAYRFGADFARRGHAPQLGGQFGAGFVAKSPAVTLGNAVCFGRIVEPARTVAGAAATIRRNNPFPRALVATGPV